MVIVVLDLLTAQIFSEPAINKLAALVETEGLGALQNPEYMSAQNTPVIQNIVGALLLTSAVFVSALKPWRKREDAKAAR